MPLTLNGYSRAGLLGAALALGLACAGCAQDERSSTKPNEATSASPSVISSGASSAAASAAAAPSASAASEAPSASAITDTPPALSASAPPPEKTAAPKPSASAKASGEAIPPKTTPKEGTKQADSKPNAGAATGAGAAASAKPDASGKPEDKPAELAPPAPGSPDAIAAQIDAIFVGRKTFSAKFTQEFTQKVSGVVKKSTGTLVVEKPNKLSFRYDPPNKNRIVSDGSQLKIYVAEDSQMFVQPVAKTEYPGALAFLLGNGLRPSFTFTFNDKAKFDGGPVLVGKPRTPTPNYEYVMFYIDKALLEKGDPNVVRRVLIVDAQGNKNRFDFQGASQPASIEPGEFIFNPPEGTTITTDQKK